MFFFCFRELRSGMTFYIICKSSKESVHLMKFTNRQHIVFFSIFEPICCHDVLNIPVVENETTIENMNIPVVEVMPDVTSFLSE